jgi:hypothetical protein
MLCPAQILGVTSPIDLACRPFGFHCSNPEHISSPPALRIPVLELLIAFSFKRRNPSLDPADNEVRRGPCSRDIAGRLSDRPMNAFV